MFIYLKLSLSEIEMQMLTDILLFTCKLFNTDLICSRMVLCVEFRRSERGEEESCLFTRRGAAILCRISVRQSTIKMDNYIKQDIFNIGKHKTINVPVRQGISLCKLWTYT